MYMNVVLTKLYFSCGNRSREPGDRRPRDVGSAEGGEEPTADRSRADCLREFLQPCCTPGINCHTCFCKFGCPVPCPVISCGFLFNPLPHPRSLDPAWTTSTVKATPANATTAAQKLWTKWRGEKQPHVVGAFLHIFLKILILFYG